MQFPNKTLPGGEKIQRGEGNLYLGIAATDWFLKKKKYFWGKLIFLLDLKMTLILSLGNNEQMIQISDRRLTNNGRLVEDESNKCGVLFCRNARMAIGYTGLARYDEFSTPEWLFKALSDSARPEYAIGEILKKLKVNATKTFLEHESLRDIPWDAKRLAVMFSGFINLDGNWIQGCAILSNYHNLQGKQNDFFNIYYSQARKGEEWPTLVQRVGNSRAMTNHDVDQLRELLEQKKPVSQIIDKAVTMMCDIADRPDSQGTIGKQLTSVVIPFDTNLKATSNYHSNIVKRESYMPALICLLPDKHFVVDNIRIEPVSETDPPLSIPKVGN